MRRLTRDERFILQEASRIKRKLNEMAHHYDTLDSLLQRAEDLMDEGVLIGHEHLDGWGVNWDTGRTTKVVQSEGEWWNSVVKDVTARYELGEIHPDIVQADRFEAKGLHPSGLTHESFPLLNKVWNEHLQNYMDLEDDGDFPGDDYGPMWSKASGELADGTPIKRVQVFANGDVEFAGQILVTLDPGGRW